MYGEFPAKNTACTSYVRTNVQLWSSLNMKVRCTVSRMIPMHNTSMTKVSYSLPRVKTQTAILLLNYKHRGWPEPYIYGAQGTSSRTGAVKIKSRSCPSVHRQFFWQGYHQIYGHIRCMYTVLARPSHICTHSHLPRASASETSNSDNIGNME
jgi:uncharacterized protein YmfQ (DUF2313 family)